MKNVAGGATIVVERWKQIPYLYPDSRDQKRAHSQRSYLWDSRFVMSSSGQVMFR